MSKATVLMLLVGLMLTAIGVYSEAPAPLRVFQVPIEVTGLSVAPLAAEPLFEGLNALCDFDSREKPIHALFRTTLFVTYRDNNANGIPDNGDEVLEIQPKKGVATFLMVRAMFPYTCTLSP